jgi:hypothetical protein
MPSVSDIMKIGTSHYPETFSGLCLVNSSTKKALKIKQPLYAVYNF